MTTAIEFRNVCQSYRRKEVLNGLDLKIEAGSFSVILGAPGCGKSVVLRLLAGLEKPKSGEVYLRGVDAAKLSPGERNIGYTPQSFALYPNYKVYDNIAYPLTLAGETKAEIDRVVRQTADMLHITKLLNKLPNQLSGGEKQRVAIARGIAKKTDIFVFDDPLTGLDFKLREQLFDDLKNMQDTLKATFIYTTSDSLEALMLAKDINILDGCRCVEAGPLETVYAHPANAHSMELLGFPKANMLPGSMIKVDGQDVCETLIGAFPVRLEEAPCKEVLVGIRPQHLQLEAKAAPGWITSPARIVLKEDLGGELVVHLQVGEQMLLSVIRQDEVRGLSEESTTIGIQPADVLVFEPGSGRRMGQGAQ
ncbi:ABC transporter ATP-binding protein [bacterium]|nr:MAG: ABC transporter ATP-binding protein [bacterium]